MSTGTGIYWAALFACATWLIIAKDDQRSLGMLGVGVGVFLILRVTEKF